MREYDAYVLKVIDGDTYILEVDLGFNIKVKEKFRMLHVDTYETSKRKSPSITEEEIILGKKITKEIVSRILYKNVKIKIPKKNMKDKYGRYLAEIYYHNKNNLISLNDEIKLNGWSKV